MRARQVQIGADGLAPEKTLETSPQLKPKDTSSNPPDSLGSQQRLAGRTGAGC